MLSKIRSLVMIAALVCLVYLCYMTYIIEREDYQNLLLAAPNNQNAGGVSVKEIETLNQEKFMLTYETNNQKTVLPQLSDAKFNSQSAVVKGTNFTYPFVMSFNMISGGFFTSTAQERQSKSAVLNELAAFELFGGTNIAGNQISIDKTVYSVVGVINDRDTENKNVYIPITLLSETPNTFVVTLDENVVIEEYAKNELSKIGVTSSAYSFYNLGQTAQVIFDRAFLSFAAVGCAILVFIFMAGLHSFKRNLELLRSAFKYNSLPRLFIISPGEMFNVIASSTFIAASIGAFVWILAFIANTMLGWDTYSSDIGEYAMTPFAQRLVLLQDYSYNSNIVFIAFIALLLLSVVLLTERQ